MRRTPHVLLLTLLTAVLLPLSPQPSGAAPASCPAGPVELVGGGATELVAGQDHVQGYVLRRRLGGGETCVVAGATVQLLARITNTSTTTVARTGTTDAQGRVEFRVRPPYTVVLTGRFVGSEGFPQVDSDHTVLTVSTRITVNRRALSGCRVLVTGSTYPAKPGNGINIESRRGYEPGPWLGSTTARADGTYSRTVQLPCGSADRIYATIPQTARNTWGSSELQLAVATTTRTCGTAMSASGAVAELTHAFDPFNTTTAVGGAWWGERVVSNRSDRTLTFSASSLHSYQLLRRGTAVRIGSNATSDAIQSTGTELAPGEELRERVALVAGNCHMPAPPGYAVMESSPGPPFPAGTALVGQTVLSTDRGTSVSQRVALTVS